MDMPPPEVPSAPDLGGRVRPLVDAFRKRAWQLVGGVPVRTKTLGIALSAAVLMGAGLTVYVRGVLLHANLAEFDLRGRAIVAGAAVRSATVLAASGPPLDGPGATGQSGARAALAALSRELRATSADLDWVVILDDHGNVLGSDFGTRPMPTGLLARTADGPREGLRAELADGTRVYAWPLPPGGEVRIGMSEDRIRALVDAVTVQGLLTTLVVGLVATAVASLLSWLLTRPILELAVAARRAGEGDLGVRVDRWADDEIGELSDAFNDMLAEVDAGRAQIEEQRRARGRLLEKVINAQEDERKRIARELHDDVGQALTSISVGLRALQEQADHSPLARRAVELRSVADESLTHVRLLSRELRPSVLDDLGLAAALERFVDDYTERRPGLAVDVHCEAPERLPPAVETALYRIVQEAMTNAARHSGASNLSVLLRVTGGRCRAIIEDDGRGFDPEAHRRAGRSVGIHGMVERAELLGGRVDIESGPEGTTVFVEVPL